MLGNLIGGFITIIIGVSLVPTVADQVESAVGNASATNVTGAAVTLTELVVLFYAIGIMSAGIAIAATGLRQAGLMGV